MAALSPTRIIAIVSGVLGGLVVMGTAAFLFWASLPTPSAADMLPADTTVVLFENVTAKDLTPYITWFPSLRDVRLPSGTFDLAMIENSEGPAWLTFEKADATTPQDGTIVDRGFVIRASQPLGNTQWPLTNAEQSLARSPTYKQFGVSAMDGPFGFIDTKAIDRANRTALDLWFLQHVEPYRYVLVRMNTQRWSLSVPVASNLGRLALPEPVSVSGAVSLSLAHPEQAWKMLVKPLSPTDTSILTALVGDQAQKLVSSNVSIPYTVVPLLAGPVTFTFTPPSGGPIGAFIESKGINATTVATHLQTIRQAYQNATPPVNVTSHQFNEQFGAVVVDSGTARTQEQTADVNGWTVFSIAGATGDNGLVTGQKGTLFFITNRPSWVQARMNGLTRSLRADVAAMELNGAALEAAGTGDMAGIRSLLGLLPVLPAQSSLFPTLQSQNGPVRWYVEQTRGMLTFSTDSL